MSNDSQSTIRSSVHTYTPNKYESLYIYSLSKLGENEFFKKTKKQKNKIKWMRKVTLQ